MAVKTVNAQGYDAVMTFKGVAAKAADGGAQSFGAILNKAGGKIADTNQTGVNDVQALKSPEKQDTRVSRITASGQQPDGKLEEAEPVADAESKQIAADEKPAGEAKLEEADGKEAKPEDVKADQMPEKEALDAAEADESGEKSADNMTIAQISGALMQIIEQIKELLGVSGEEILAGMEKADIKLTDLLEPADMSKLLTVIAGEGEVVSLVTNGELYSKLQELTKTVENVSAQLLKEMGLTQEELDAVLEKLSKPENADALRNANPQDLMNPQAKDTDKSTVPEPKIDVKAAIAEPKEETKAVIETETEAEPMPETETKAVIETETKAEPMPETEAKLMPETEAKPMPETETKATPETPAKAVTETETKVTPETVTKPVNETVADSAGKEEAAAVPEEDADIHVETKQPGKTTASDANAESNAQGDVKDNADSNAKDNADNSANNSTDSSADKSIDSAAKKQADSMDQNQQNNTAAQMQPKAAARHPKERADAHEQKNSSGNFGGQQNAQGFDNRLNAVYEASSQTARYTSENTESILRQLADIVRIARNENLTQMEMQLHPASLGTVNVSLVTKGGAVTAEFTTQNEAAKAAIEANAAQLIKNLESQGVKVEAVEVSVAGHQLERNLDENNRNDQSRQEKEEAQRIQGARRNSINLNAYTDDEEMLEEMQGADDATRIAMELMAANGNSMDIMA